MKILMIGATGYIGGTVARALEQAGHTVVPLVRPAPEGVRPEPTDPDAVVGDLSDLTSLRTAVTPDIDAVVHAGAPLGDWAADTKAVTALLDRIRPGGAFVYVSGTWVVGPSDGGFELDERSPARPIDIVAGREAVEHAVLSSNARGVVVSLADLVVLAVSQAPGGTLLHGVTEPSVPVIQVSRAADVAVGGAGRAVPWDVDEAAAALGAAFAEALALNQRVSAASARSLGWCPTRQTLLDDLRQGSYAARQSVD